MSFMEKTDGQFAWEDGYKLHPTCTYSDVFMLAGSIGEWNDYGDMFGASGVHTIIGALNHLQTQVSADSLWDRSGTVLIPDTATDTLRVGEGSKTAPSYAFGGNVDSGMYSDVAGGKYLAFSANDNEVLSVSGTKGWIISAAGFDLAATGEVDIDASAFALDATSTSNLTVTGTSSVDLTLSATTSSGDSRVLISSGSEIDLSTGNVDINATGAFTIDGVATSNVTVSGTGTVALNLEATSGTSAADVNIVADREIDLTSSAVDINAVAAVDINAGATSVFVVDGAHLTVGTSTSGNATLSGATNASIRAGSGVFDVRTNATPVQRLEINADGDWDVDAKGYVHVSTSATTIDASALSLDATSTSNLTVTGTAAVDLAIGATTSSGDARVLITAGSEIDLTASNVDINATAAFSVDGVTDSNVSVAGTGTVALSIAATSSTSAADVNISADREIDLTASTVDINAAAAVSMNAGATSIFTVAGADLTLTTTTSGTITLGGATNTSVRSGSGVFDIRTNASPVQRLQINASGDWDADANDFTLDAIEGISLDAAAASNFTVAEDTLSLSTTTSGSMIINSAENVTFTYNEAAAGSALYLVNDDTTVGTFSSSIAFQALTDGNITLTVTDSLVTGPAITLDANGAAAAINLDSDFDITNVYNNAAGAGSYSIYEDTTQILDIDASGAVKWTPGGAFEIDTDANTTSGYSLIDGIYFVNGKNTTAFATLLQGLSTGAHIVLGPGTHDISWTTAQTFSRDMKISGSGASTTAIRFTSNDADCCLNFTGTLELYGVTVTRSVSMTNQAYAIQLAAPGSIISDCIFETDAQAAPTWTSISVLAAAEDTVLRNIRFETNYSSYWHINANAPRIQIDNCTATGEDDSTGSVKLTATAEYSKVVNCYFQSSNGATATPNLEIAADYVKVTDSTFIAGTSAATGHGVRCFTFSGGHTTVSGCTVHALWPASNNCTDRIVSVAGSSNRFVNSEFKQLGYNYTSSAAIAGGAINVTSSHFRMENCHVEAEDCKAALYFSGGADYPYIANTYIAKVHSFDGATRESACIYTQSGCHYGSISHNYLYPDGSTLAYAVGGSASNGSDYWSIIGNVVRLGAGPCRGIRVSQYQNCTVIGNTANPAGSAVYGTNTNNEYGSGSSTAPGTNN